MELAERIRIVLSEMDGNDYGKQARLAEIAGCGRPVVNHWLRSKQDTINSKHAMRIASALGYRVEWLMDGRGPRRDKTVEPDEVRQIHAPHKEVVFNLELSEEEMQIIAAWRKADAMDRTVFRHLFLKTAGDSKNN